MSKSYRLLTQTLLEMFKHSWLIINCGCRVPTVRMGNIKISVEQRIEKALRVSLGFQQVADALQKHAEM